MVHCMCADDVYFTIEHRKQATIKIKGSRFIGTIAPVKDEAAAKKFVEEISKQFFDATHNCYAYVVGCPPKQITRVNDDGEPSGTAGQPILSVIQGMNLNFICAVVTRYFGGTKLGKGGLIRAYSECTRQALSKCNIKKEFIKERVKFSFPYDSTGTVMHVISQFAAQLIDSKYGSDTEMTVQIRKSKAQGFKEQLIEATSGKLTFL